ncbi:hypothetical protein BJX70DRAFT_401304 [Aspergillus crustosus]
MLRTAKEPQYKPLPNDNEDLGVGIQTRPYPTKLHILCFVLSLITAFATGVLLTIYISNTSSTQSSRFGVDEDASLAPYIPLPVISGEFIHQSPFSKEPPLEGNVSEPIWDALIPNGLGYFIPPASNTTTTDTKSIVIPSAFHQLHCLYLLRRAYYTRTPESNLQRFDFGRNRTIHVAHCFDYLVQAITCSADSTLEPAVDKEHGFLGAGFERRCWDFGNLKTVVEGRRAFDAEGFLAWGLGEEGVVELR